MSGGSVRNALKTHRFIAVLLVVVIAILVGILGLADLSKPWTITVQVGTAVAGAALGNYLRMDFSNSVVYNQARPATRHLFDQVGRLRKLVLKAEGYQSAIVELSSVDGLDPARTSDWFGSLGASLRDEINATALAIENWGDLAPDVRDDELKSYGTRLERLPEEERQQEGHV